MIPIHQGRRVRYGKDGEQIVEDFEGYYLTVEELAQILHDYVPDILNVDISNNKTWIEQYLKEL